MYLFSAEDRKKFAIVGSDSRLGTHCAEAIIRIWETTTPCTGEEDITDGEIGKDQAQNHLHVGKERNEKHPDVRLAMHIFQNFGLPNQLQS